MSTGTKNHIRQHDVYIPYGVNRYEQIKLIGINENPEVELRFGALIGF